MRLRRVNAAFRREQIPIALESNLFRVGQRERIGLRTRARNGDEHQQCGDQIFHHANDNERAAKRLRDAALKF